MCVDSYHSNSILYVSCEAQELGKLSMAHSEVKVPGNVFWIITKSLIAMNYAYDNLKVKFC